MRDLVVVVALALVALAFWKFRVLDPGAELAAMGPPWKLGLGYGDMFVQVYPQWQRVIRSIQAGDLPLWNPYQFCGHPLHASVLHGIFYPLNLPRFFLPTGLALEVTAVLHLVVAGVFMYLYCRVIALGRPAAAAAALVFMLSGSIVLRAAWFPAAIGAAVWLPLAFLAVEKIFRTHRPGWLALLAFAVAMPILAGNLQLWVYSMHSLGLYAGLRVMMLLLRSESRRRLIPCVALLVGGVALGVSLAAVQLLPSWELLQLGPRRPGALSIELATTNWGVRESTPEKLIAHLTDARASRLPGRGYVGILALVLVPLSLVAEGGRARVAFLWLLASASIAISLGTQTPLFDLYRKLPAAAWFRIPSRIMFLYTFAVSVLVGIGLDLLVRRKGGTSQSRLVIAASLATLVALVSTIAIDMPLRSRTQLGLGMALVWGAVLLRHPRQRWIPLGLLVALMAADVFVANRYVSMRPFQALAAFDSHADLFGFIERNQKLQRTYVAHPWMVSAGLAAKQGSLRGIFSITDYEILTLDRFARFYRSIDVPGWGTDRTGLESAFYGSLNLDFTARNLALLDLMSVRFIAIDLFDAPALDVLQSTGWLAVHRPVGSRFVVYENPRALPRAYLVHAAERAASEDEAFRAIRRDTFDPRRSVVLEAPAEAVTLPTSADAAARDWRVHIASFEPNEVVMQTESRAPGFLVLTDTFYPGWKSFVDGEEQTILRANYLFRAVRLPAGRHRVRFSYEPASFRAGASLSLVALAVVLLIAWRARGGVRNPNGPGGFPKTDHVT